MPVEILNQTGKRMVLVPMRLALEAGLRDLNREDASLQVVILVNDEIRALNRETRQVDAETDVLSFPAPSLPGFENWLGEIAISIDFARAQATIRNVRVVDELAMLAVHGLLHLAGWDDETEGDRQKMVDRQNQILTSAGLPTDADWHSLPH